MARGANSLHRLDRWILGLMVAPGVLACLLWLGAAVRGPDVRSQPLSAVGLLGSAPEAFARVTERERLSFPRDHGMHPGFRNEWWYFTGNLEGPDGHRLGWQFTLFRFALEPADRPDSQWSADAVWMAHLALSDAGANRFYSEERFAREALGLVGATADEWWLRDWQVNRVADGWRLRAKAREFELDLSLQSAKPIVLQGDAGYSRKGPEPGQASRYYSVTRIETSGTISLDQRRIPVTGWSWLDREWGSRQVGPELAGWDWFALQLDDGRDLMIYRLRTQDGSHSPYSAGSLVDPGGNWQVLGSDDFTAQPLRSWRDRAGVDWPVAWRIELPSADLELLVEPVFDEQRWFGTVSYWEGAVDVLDIDRKRVVGRGYLELSGYAEAATPSRTRR